MNVASHDFPLISNFQVEQLAAPYILQGDRCNITKQPSGQSSYYVVAIIPGNVQLNVTFVT